MALQTLTLTPQYHAETSCVDGVVTSGNLSATSWPTVVNASGSSGVAYDTSEAPLVGSVRIVCTAWSQYTPDQLWDAIWRTILLFDASSLAGKNIRIDSATLKVRVNTAAFNNRHANFDPTIGVVSSNPASHTALVNTDYAQLGSTLLSDATPQLDDFVGATPCDYTWTLNAAGRTAIEDAIANHGGIVGLGLREAAYDISGTTPPYNSSQFFNFHIIFAAYLGTVSQFPTLTLTYEEYEDPAATPSDINDVLHIIKDSCSQTLANPTANRVRYRYGLNYATGKWDYELTADNTEDQAALGEVVEQVVDFPWVRDADTALTVAERILNWLDEDAWQISLEGPLSMMQGKDLATDHEVDHHAILGGVPLTYKIIERRADPDAMKIRITGIRDVAAP